MKNKACVSNKGEKVKTFLRGRHLSRKPDCGMGESHVNIWSKTFQDRALSKRKGMREDCICHIERTTGPICHLCTFKQPIYKSSFQSHSIKTTTTKKTLAPLCVKEVTKAQTFSSPLPFKFQDPASGRCTFTLSIFTIDIYLLL